MERELKWRACPADLHAAAQWAQPLCVHHATQEMDARYYDTKDGYLSAQQAGLRLRLQNGVQVCCLKCGGTVVGAVHLREEYECSASSIEEGLLALPDAGAPALLCQEAARRGVQESCRMRFTRRALTLQDGDVSAELALDLGTLCRKGREAPLCEIELEHKRGSDAAFFALSERFAAVLPLAPEPLSKLARALLL